MLWVVGGKKKKNQCNIWDKTDFGPNCLAVTLVGILIPRAHQTSGLPVLNSATSATSVSYAVTTFLPTQLSYRSCQEQGFQEGSTELPEHNVR